MKRLLFGFLIFLAYSGNICYLASAQTADTAVISSSEKYSESELLKGSDKLDSYWEKLEICQVGVRASEGKLFVAVFNLTDEKEEKIKDISGIKNIEFAQYSKDDTWDYGKNDKKNAYDEAINKYKNEILDISFIEESNILKIKNSQGISIKKLNENIAFIENGTTYINPEYVGDILEQPGFVFYNNKNTGLGLMKLCVLLDEDYNTLDNYFIFKSGDKYIKFSDGNIKMGVPPISKNGKLYIPLRAFLNSIGMPDDQITYSEKIITVTLKDDFVKNLNTAIKGRNDKFLNAAYMNDGKDYIVYDDVYYSNENSDYKKYIYNYIKENADKNFDEYAFDLSENNIGTETLIELIPKDTSQNYKYTAEFYLNKLVLIRKVDRVD